MVLMLSYLICCAVHNYPKSEQEVLKDGKALLDFKYACAGYSVHRDNKSMSKTNPELEKHGELPFCMGIEVMRVLYCCRISLKIWVFCYFKV